MVPFFVLVDLALQARSRAVLVLTALVLATMLSVYPLYIALLIGTAVVMVAARGVVLRRAGTPLRPLLRPLALSIVAVAALSLAFDPIAVLRDVHYYGLVLNNEVPYPRVSYTLPLDVLPGWISQTREFWALPGLTTGGFKQILLGVLLPLAFLGYVAVGLRRYPRALALVAMAAICAVAAEYSYVSQQSCTYCAERVLLPFGPIAAVLVALGVCALVASHSRWWQAAGAIGVLLVLVPVAQRARIELIRFANDSYFLDGANAALLSRVPSARGAIEEEGYGASLAAQAEQPLVYHLINERAPGRVSIVLGSDAGNAIQYLDFGPPRLPPGPEFDPRYRYVLTRLARSPPTAGRSPDGEGSPSRSGPGRWTSRRSTASPSRWSDSARGGSPGSRVRHRCVSTSPATEAARSGDGSTSGPPCRCPCPGSRGSAPVSARAP